MAGLTGSTIASSYEQLLIVADGGLTTSLQAIQDGDGGVTSCLKIAKDKLEIIPNAANNANLFEVSQYDGTSILNINSTTPGATLTGTLTVTGALTVGVDDTGHDVKLFGATASHYLLWDESADDLIVVGGMYATGTAAGGTTNSVYGKGAGAALASGATYNLFFGEDAGKLLQQGDNNIAIGYAALDAADATESYNIAIGSNAMGAVDEGAGGGGTFLADSNIAIGYNALLGGAFGGNNYSLLGNIAIGHEALKLTATNAQTGTVAIGYYALNALTSGAKNTAIGYTAGTAITTGDHNTALGYESLVTNITGDGNTAIGYKSLYTSNLGNTYGYSTAVGFQSGMVCTGADNVFVGSYNGDAATSLRGAVIIGAQAGRGVMTSAAVGTVAIGMSALTALTSGIGNVAVGYQAGLALSTSQNNLAIGYQALSKATTATDNCIAIGNYTMDGNFTTADLDAVVCIGYQAMRGVLTSGALGTVAIGASALAALTTGAGNTAVGYNAMLTNAEGEWNTAVGYEALYTAAHNDGDGLCTIMGYRAGKFISTGINNTFIGGQAGQGITGTPLTGSSNTAIGKNAGLELEGAAHSNTFLGATAGDTTEAGVENTCLGFACKAEDDTATNQVVIGNNCTGTADNAVHIGNDSNILYTAFSSDSWSATSDIRQKKNIQDDTLGLEFINSLRTTTYRHKSPSEFPEEWTSYNPDDKEPMDGDRVFHSLIAQEVKQSLDDIGCKTFDGWSVDPDGRQRVARTSFVTPLIKAVQELSAEVEKLKNK